jgi:branched-subunit amino acid transport protein
VTTLWAAVLLASLGCDALKLAGVSLPLAVLNHSRVQRIAGLLPVAMLSALVVVELLADEGRYGVDWRTVAGVAAGAVALLLKRSVVVVFLVAISATAVLRLLT